MWIMVAAAMAAQLDSCKVEDAVYQQRQAPSITARFIPVEPSAEWPSGLAMKMHFGDSGRTYWWLPWNGGSNGRQNLASTTDVTAPGWKAPHPEDQRGRPLGDVGYMGMDAAYNILAVGLRRGGQAPAHFLVPDLRAALWYRTDPSRRDADSGQLFDLVACPGSALAAAPAAKPD